jgi:exodeoxyribonuclease VII small subunit
MAQKKLKTYQEMADELSQLVDWFENESLNLDEAVAKYEQAMQLLDDMEAYIKTAQNKIKKIAVRFEQE